MATGKVEFVKAHDATDRIRGGGHPGLITEQRKNLAEKFLGVCGGRSDCQMTRQMLHDFAGVQTKFHNDRLFTLITEQNRKKHPGNNGESSITFADFIAFVQKYSAGNEASKTKLLFDIYDSNGDGRLDKKELIQMLSASMKENKLELDETLLDDMATTLLEEGLGEEGAVAVGATLGLEEFRKLFQGHKELIDNLSTVIEKWLQPVPEKKKRSGPGSKRCRSMWHYLQKNSAYAFWVAAFFITNFALFVARLFMFFKDEAMQRKDFWALAVARGFGFCLNFSSSFILFTMMRQFLTRLRPTVFFNFLPIDDHKAFHRIVGKWIVFASLGHMTAHLVNVKFAIDRQEDGDKRWNYFTFLYNLEATQTLGLIPGCAYLSGFSLIFILLIMFFFTFSFVRRNGYFHAFYLSHIIGYPIFYVLLVLHCQNFWKWFVGPFAMFAIEQVFRTYYNWFGYKTTIKMGIILPSRVTNLIINRPPGFNFSPGDYVFINLPYLSRFEWHAFTISSAPENWDELSLHIRAVGPWTEHLYEVFCYLRKTSDIQVQFPNGQPATHDPRIRNATRRSFLRTNKISKNFGRAQKVRSLLVDDSLVVGQGCGQRMLHTAPTSANDTISTLPKNYSVMAASNYRHQIRRPDTVVIGNQDDIEALRNKSKNGIRPGPRMISTAPSVHPAGSSGGGARADLQPLIGAEPKNEQALPDTYTQILGKPLKAYIDGPYGAPASEIFRAEHAILIGAGIGVTPFASILQSIMYRHWATKITCPKCTCKFSHGFQAQVNQLKKVDFYWTNPEQNAFTWFVSLLSKLEIEQEELGGEIDRFLDIHMYMTKALQRNDMKAVALQLVLDLFYEKNKRDCLTKLKARMNAGRPVWNNVMHILQKFMIFFDLVFKKIQKQNHGAVSVFFCGPKAMGNEIEKLCVDYGFTFRTETF